jgi:hypothetical protein
MDIEISLGTSGMRIDVDNTHIIKIWLTKPNARNPLGGFANEIRLIQEKAYSKRNITLLYEPQNLSHEAHHKLLDFSRRHQIQLMTIDDIQIQLESSTTISAESRETQFRLLEFARREINDLNGNLAAASDILRTLTPVLQTPTGTPRMYIDVDDQLRPSLETSISLHTNSLLKPFRCNNFLLTADPENQTLIAVREKILKTYINQDEYLEKALDKAISDGWNLGVGIGPLEAIQSLQRLFMVEGYFIYEEVAGCKPCVDIFEFRRIINNEIRRLQHEIEQNPNNKNLYSQLIYYQNVYLYSVINVSGPEAFELSGLSVKSKKNCLRLSFQSDISWGHDPKNLIEHQRMIDAGHKIISFFKKIKTSESSSQEEPSQESRSSPKTE